MVNNTKREITNKTKSTSNAPLHENQKEKTNHISQYLP